jgi:hypothetical protein
VASQTYCTPNRYRLGGYGLDLGGFSAAQLRQKMVQGTAKVDSWCNRAMQPQRSDMRGGTVTGEQHSWPVTSPLVPLPGDRRVYLNSRPIRSVTGFAIKFTDTWELTLPPSNLFVNTTQGYIEVVATQPSIIGYPPIGIWFGLSEPVLSVDYTYGWQFEVEGDPLEADSPLLYYASHGNWLPGGDVAVTVAGVTIDPTDYTVREDDGAILFDQSVEPGADDEVLADYTYTLPQAVSDAAAIISTDLMGKTAIARRGMLGLSSIKVAEVSLTQMPSAAVNYVTKNGVTIPADAAALLGPYALGRIG